MNSSPPSRSAPQIPEGFGEREEKPRNARFPVKIGEGIEQIAAATGQEWTPTMFFLLQWAITAWKAENPEAAKDAAKGSKNR